MDCCFLSAVKRLLMAALLSPFSAGRSLLLAQWTMLNESMRETHHSLTLMERQARSAGLTHLLHVDDDELVYCSAGDQQPVASGSRLFGMGPSNSCL